MKSLTEICSCNHCSERIEFDPTKVGNDVQCSKCGLTTTLYFPAGRVTEAPDPPLLKSPPQLPGARICAQCECTVSTTQADYFSTPIFLGLLFLLIIPGLVYAIVTCCMTYRVCEYCGSRALLHPNSPRAQEIIQRHAARQILNGTT